MGVGVGEEGRGRVAEVDVGEDLAHPVGSIRHQRGVGGDADRQHDGPLRTQRFGRLRGGLHRGAPATHDDLAG